jgi:hypothetical protein
MLNPSRMVRLLGFHKLGLLAAFLGITLFWACHLNPNDSSDAFDVVGDSTWTKCDSVLIVLLDKDNKVVDTIFNDTLSDLDQLKQLSAEKYKGGQAKVHISGRKNGGVCFDETRTFDAATDKVVVDTILSPDSKITSLEILPHALTLAPEDAATEVSAAIKPAYAEQSFTWTIENSEIAVLVFTNGINGNKIKVKPVKAGTVKIKATSKKDPTKSDELILKVVTTEDSKVIVSPDSVQLFVGGPGDSLVAKVLPEGTDQGVEWTSDDAKIAKVDGLGRVKPVGEGITKIRAKSLVLGLSDSTAVTVLRDLPTLTVASRSGAAVNTVILFSAKVTQKFGTIVMYKWDFTGDDDWDDSLTGPWLGNAVDLPAISTKYTKEGKFIAKFFVRDSEGNEAIALVSLDIGNQAPEILNISVDTTISIKDSISLFAKVRDFEGKVVWCAWDFEGDGSFDDSVTTADSVVDIVFGHRYKPVGNFNAILRVKDDAGKARLDTVKVKVVLDPPVADAGLDTTVMAETFVSVHAKGTDKFGSIAKRDIKIGDGAFIAVSKQDTSVRPPVTSGKFNVVVRVTDDDGNSAQDTMVVTVSTPSMSNADLAELIPSKGSLAPSFKPIAALYSLAVAFADSQITIKATTSDALAKLAINGIPVLSGASSDLISILVGLNRDVVQLVVTAQDGTQKIYSISVTRAPSAEAQLSKLEATGMTLKPAFNSGTLDYADTVANAVSSITLTPTVSVSGSKVTVNDLPVTSGSASGALPLKVGDNKMTVLVTAQDGKTKATYTVSVVRLAKLIVTRKLAVDSALILTDSIEAPLGSVVKIQTPTHPAFQFLNWTISEGTGILGDATLAATTLTLQSATVRVQASYKLKNYLIKTLVNGGIGSGTATVTPSVVPHGADAVLTIIPSVGYRIKNVMLDSLDITTAALKNGGVLTFPKVTSGHTITVTFFRTYTLTSVSTTPASGTITPGAPTLVVDSGTSQAFTMTASANNIVSALTDSGTNVIGSLVSVSPTVSTYTLNDIKANHAVSATFALKSYSISTKFDKARGVLTPSDLTVVHGGDASINIVPEKGYRLLALMDNDKDVTDIANKNKLTYPLTGIVENHGLIATFMRVYTVTGITNDIKLGTISPLSQTVDSMGSMDFTLTTQTFGQFVSGLLDNDKDGLPNLSGDPLTISTYTLKEIISDHSISATYTQKTYTLTVNGINVCIRTACPVGQICLIQKCPIGAATASRTINHGSQTQYVISTADSSGTTPFSSWGGTPVASGNPATVGPITANTTYTAKYLSICPIKGCIIIIDPPIIIGSTATPSPVITPVVTDPNKPAN